MNRMNSRAIDNHGGFNCCTQWQVGNLPYIREIRSKMIMGSRAGNVFNHLKRTFRIRFKQIFNSEISIGHFVQSIQSKVTQAGHRFPIIQADIKLLPWFGDRIAHQREIFTQVSISRYRKQTEVLKDTAGERLKAWFKFKETFAEKRIEILPGT